MAMENALLVGLSRQVALRRELDVVANNMANMNTTGFKREALIYHETPLKPAKVNTFQKSDRPVSFVIDFATMNDFSEGSVEQTGNPMDVAIKGDAFMMVQTENGERYTRNGALQINNLGVLVNNEGKAILGESGTLVFGPEERDFSVARDGTVSTSEGVKGKLRLVTFSNPQVLEKEGESLFKTGVAPEPAPNTISVMQGMVERSNVRPIVEISRMIELNRAFESITKIVQSTDETRKSAIERLARVA
jgi:flagellar basal-body rod protein FlgF